MSNQDLAASQLEELENPSMSHGVYPFVEEDDPDRMSEVTLQPNEMQLVYDH